MKYLKAQKRMNNNNQCSHENQFILASANSYYHFHILFMCPAL